MVVKLRNYIGELFKDAPQTKKVADFKDELTANAIEKYNDLLLKGKTEEEAYEIVITGLGDVNEIIASLKEGNYVDLLNESKERKTTAKFTAIAVSLYICSIVPVLLFGILGNQYSGLGVVLMFVFIAVATGLLVYRNASRPKYVKTDETLVEDFKEWKASKSKNTSLRNTVSSAMWTLIVALYFIISFWFGIWAYSWIIFIIGAAIEKIIKAVFDMRSEQ